MTYRVSYNTRFLSLYLVGHPSHLDGVGQLSWVQGRSGSYCSPGDLTGTGKSAGVFRWLLGTGLAGEVAGEPPGLSEHPRSLHPMSSNPLVTLGSWKHQWSFFVSASAEAS